MGTFVVKGESELRGVAEALLRILKTHEGTAVLALTGELGAGKTALTQALAGILGVSEQVTSPTFVIMKSYNLPSRDRFSTLTHIDAYRIEDEEELTVLGWNELLTDPERLLVVEWPERIPRLIPTDALTVRIAFEGGEERTITYGE